MMDRPEWTAARPRTGSFQDIEIYCTLTNNNRRGSGGANPSSNNADGSTVAASARPAVDVANPRPDNDYGHIIRWREDGRSVRATGFEWDIFVLCGDSAVPTSKTVAGSYSKDNFLGVDANTGNPEYSKRMYEGNIVDSPAGSADFGAPDGMWFDYFGRLWIQTDQAGDAKGDWMNIGSNVMVCADPVTKEVRRFLTSPPNCEVTGVDTTPDGTAMFVGIQHPGEAPTGSNDPANPKQFSSWPDGPSGGRPRSSCIS
jgi:secreted PhoX family phosphatase